MQRKFTTLRLQIIGSIIITTVIILILLYLPMRHILTKSYTSLEEHIASQRAVDPGEISAHGRTTLTYLGAAILLAGVAFSAAMWWLLGRLVLARLSDFRADIANIGVLSSTGNFSSRVPVKGEDELSQLSATVNGMLDNLEQYQKELLIQKQRFENLVAVARATVERPDLEATMKNALEAARAITRAERGSVFVLDELGAVTYSILAREGVSSAERQKVVGQVMDIGLAGWVARHREAALVTDTEQDPRWFPLPDTPYVARSALVVPIFSGPRKLGILTLTHPEVEHFNQDDLELMQAAADQMALAIRNAQIYDDQRRLAERQTTLYETLRTIGTLLDPDAVLLVAVDKIAAMTNWPVVTILLPDKKTEKLTLRASAGQLPLPEQWSIAPNYGNIGRVFRSGELLYIDNTQTHTAGVMENEIQGTLTDEQRRLLNIADRSTQRMLNLVNAILDISRLENGQMPLEYAIINLHDFVEDIIQSQTPLAINKALHIENMLLAELPPVVGDRGLLEQVLQNLIGNAIKFTPSGGTVRITEREEANDPPRYISRSAIPARAFRRKSGADCSRNLPVASRSDAAPGWVWLSAKWSSTRTTRTSGWKTATSRVQPSHLRFHTYNTA